MVALRSCYPMLKLLQCNTADILFPRDTYFHSFLLLLIIVMFLNYSSNISCAFIYSVIAEDSLPFLQERDLFEQVVFSVLGKGKVRILDL